MSLVGVQGEERDDLTRAESARIRRRSLRLLGSLLRPVRRPAVLGAAAVVLSAGLRASGPAIIAYGIDVGLPALMHRASLMPLLGALGAYLVVGVGGALLTAWYTVLAARVSQAILFDLRTRVFRHTQRLSLEFHERYTSGRIIARQTSDLDSLQDLLGDGINELIQAVLSMLFVAIAIFVVDWGSGLVLLVALVPATFLSRWFQVTSARLFRRTRVASARVIVQFVETMTGIRAVQAFRTEKRLRHGFAGLVEDYRAANARTLQVFGLFEPGLVLIGNVTLGVVLLIGGFRVAGGSLAVGALLAALLYTRSFFQPAQDIAMFYNGYQSAEAALEKISGVLEEEPSVPDPARPTALPHARGAIAFERVRFQYTPDRVVLPDLALTIPAGQTLALVGTTGAGKSTLAKLVSRFYDPSAGVVRLDGVDLRQLEPHDLRRSIVMVTQEAYLFSGTVADNIALGDPDASRAQIEAAARAVGADAFIRSLPYGYDTEVNKRGGRVSAGQRQLLSFARAFLADPAVLILDEATASLDIPSERLVQEALQTLLADRTAIIIAHRLSTVSIADRVLVMEHGRIVEDDTPDALIAGEGRFAQLHAAWRDSLV